MKKFISQVLVVLVLAISISAQTEDQKPVLLDEFGRVSLEEIMLRLDMFINESSKTPNSKGHIRIYGGNENCFLCRYGFGSLLDAYLKNTRKFSIEKYSIDYCDETGENRRTALYLLPPSAELPKCAETLEMPKNSVLFDSAYFFYENIKPLPLENSNIEIGPQNGEYSLNVLKKVKSLLDKSPESKIYIVGYLSTNEKTKFEDKNGETIEKTTRNLDKKSLVKKKFQNAKREFIKNGINSSQIETIEGGYVNGERKLEFWFVPKGGEIPKPKSDNL